METKEGTCMETQLSGQLGLIAHENMQEKFNFCTQI